MLWKVGKADGSHAFHCSLYSLAQVFHEIEGNEKGNRLAQSQVGD